MADYDHVINEGLRRKVGLERLYPYSTAKTLEAGGVSLGGLAMTCANPKHIVLTQDLDPTNKRQVAEFYLHEVAHLIAASEGLDQETPAEDVTPHNQFFACLVAVMYRRLGILPYMRIFDFSDTQTRKGVSGSGGPADLELVMRFDYIIRRSAQLAPLPLSIESLARKIYREDLLKNWQSNEGDPQVTRRDCGRDWLGWFQGVVVGVVVTGLIGAALLL